MLNPAKKRAPGGSSSKLRTYGNPAFLLLSLRFAWLLLRSRAYSKSFTKKFAVNFTQYSHLDWTSMSADAILDHFVVIRRELLQLWGVPILNDIRVMIFHGIFKTVLLKDADTETYLHHLKGLSDRASIKPLQALHELGRDINRALEVEGVSNLDVLSATSSWAEIEQKAQIFINNFGGRTPDELKLENPRLGENIDEVLQLSYASKDADLSLVTTSRTSSFRQLPLLKRLAAPFIVQNVREAIDYRERFRFNRAQVFGIARKAYLALGDRFVDSEVIDAREDIFYLTEDEIQTIVNGHSWNYDYRDIVKRRKAEYKSFETKSFMLRVSGEGNIPATSLRDTTPKNPHSTETRGTGVASGRVTAPAIVVETFDPTLDVSGKILIVSHVDPGWTLLLVQAAGVIAERGNALSHVAIVSREIGVPAIVGVKEAVAKFKTGEIITVDGTSGEITHES